MGCRAVDEWLAILDEIHNFETSQYVIALIEIMKLEPGHVHEFNSFHLVV
jgi:hypothetical protein